MWREHEPKRQSRRQTSSSKLAFGLILALAIVQFSRPTDALKVTQRRLSPTFTLTFVHGGSEAMMTHMDALQYCRSLGAPKPDAEIAFIQNMTADANVTAKANSTTPVTTVATTTTAGSTTTTTTTAAPASTTTEAEKNVHGEGHKPGHIVTSQNGTRFRSDLLSIHDGHLVGELMKWVLSVDNRQFWIGGLVKMIANRFRDGPAHKHLIHMWTDRTPANFRFLHFDNPELEELEVDQIACLSVDFASGKWGVHRCTTPMYFVCETVELKDEAENNEVTAASVTEITTAAITGAQKSETTTTAAIKGVQNSETTTTAAIKGAQNSETTTTAGVAAAVSVTTTNPVAVASAQGSTTVASAETTTPITVAA